MPDSLQQAIAAALQKHFIGRISVEAATQDIYTEVQRELDSMERVGMEWMRLAQQHEAALATIEAVVGPRRDPEPEPVDLDSYTEQQLQRRLDLAHRARRAKEHQLDGIRRALCDIGAIDDDDPYSHADLEDVIRQLYDTARPSIGAP